MSLAHRRQEGRSVQASALHLPASQSQLFSLSHWRMERMRPPAAVTQLLLNSGAAILSRLLLENGEMVTSSRGTSNLVPGKPVLSCLLEVGEMAILSSSLTCQLVPCTPIGEWRDCHLQQHKNKYNDPIHSHSLLPIGGRRDGHFEQHTHKYSRSMGSCSLSTIRGRRDGHLWRQHNKSFDSSCSHSSLSPIGG